VASRDRAPGRLGLSGLAEQVQRRVDRPLPLFRGRDAGAPVHGLEPVPAELGVVAPLHPDPPRLRGKEARIPHHPDGGGMAVPCAHHLGDREVQGAQVMAAGVRGADEEKPGDAEFRLGRDPGHHPAPQGVPAQHDGGGHGLVAGPERHQGPGHEDHRHRHARDGPDPPDHGPGATQPVGASDHGILRMDVLCQPRPSSGVAPRHGGPDLCRELRGPGPARGPARWPGRCWPPVSPTR
jgi:hypothetical protein